MTTTNRTTQDAASTPLSTELWRLAGSIFFLVYRAWALSLLWGWHVAGPLEWPRIGVAQFIGISLIYVVSTRTPERSKEGDEPLDVPFLTGWVTIGLGVGYLAHLFV